MGALDVVVVLAAMLLVTGLGWFFFGPRHAGAARVAGGVPHGHRRPLLLGGLTRIRAGLRASRKSPSACSTTTYAAASPTPPAPIPTPAEEKDEELTGPCAAYGCRLSRKGGFSATEAVIARRGRRAERVAGASCQVMPGLSWFASPLDAAYRGRNRLPLPGEGVAGTPSCGEYDSAPAIREFCGRCDSRAGADACPGWLADPVVTEERARLALGTAVGARSSGAARRLGQQAGRCRLHRRHDHRRRDLTMAYERPTLTKVGDFQKVTGLAGTGSPDLLGGHSLL
ncbi:hypothetical protein GCM10010254_21580 [Streptomyces chromofuscus]|nr:hypothetical protein GCM10010254_21580 [Streptomyces chromofuscus]